jgi:hypothetical protein
VLERLLEKVGCGRREQAVRCCCGTRMKSVGLRAKQIKTLLAPIEFRRSLYRCPKCGKTRFPGDEELGVEHTRYSPGVQRQVARLGSKEPFREVARDMRELAGVPLCRKEAERVSERIGQEMENWQDEERRAVLAQDPPAPEAAKTIETLYVEFDGTGVPMTPQELAGRKGKQTDGSAKTREAKLGCVFTQTCFNSEGRPVRDPASTTFVGAIEPAAQFGQRIFAEAVQRGVYKAKRVVVIGDGAEWVKNLAGLHFSQGQFIVDFYHAAEHVGDLCRALLFRDVKQFNYYRDRWTDALYDHGDVDLIIEEAQTLMRHRPNAGKDAEREIGYFQKNKQHMRYDTFRKKGMFIGSGVIEAGCKTVIGQRLKQSGMEWTVRGANAIIALRCTTQSNRADDFWEQRAA